MNLRIVFILIFLITSSALFGQSGYYGRKVMIEAGGLGRVPLVYNQLGDKGGYYENVNGSLKMSKNLLDFGFMGGVSVISKKTASFGIYGGMYVSESKAISDVGYIIDEYIFIVDRIESFQFKTVNIQPTLILSTERFTKPAGLSHEIGVSFQMTNMVQKDYLVKATVAEDENGISQNKTSVYSQYSKYQSVGLNYTLKIRKPISNRLFISYGLRYNLTIGNRVDKNVDSSVPAYDYGWDDNHNVRKSLNQQFLNVFAGLAFML